MEKNNIGEIVKSIRNINNKAEIISKEWDHFTGLEYDELTNIQFKGYKKDIIFIEEIRRITGNLHIYSIREPKKFTKEGLKNILNKLSDEKHGKIIRAKGFIES